MKILFTSLLFWSSRPEVLCQSPIFNKIAGFKPATLLKKETLAQVFPYEFCEIFKNTFFYRTLWVAAPAFSWAAKNMLFNK